MRLQLPFCPPGGARESLKKYPPAAALEHRAAGGAGHQSQTGYKVTVAARHQSRCGKHQNAERDSRRAFPRVRALTELQRRQTRAKEELTRSSHPVSAAAAVAFAGCMHTYAIFTV